MDKKDQDHKKDQDNKKDQDSEDNEDTDEKEYMYKDMEKKESKDMSLVKTMVSLVKKGDMNMKERRAVAGGVGGVGVGGAHRVRQEADAPRPAPRAAQLRCPAAPSSCSPMRRTVDRPWLCWQRRVERGVV